MSSYIGGIQIGEQSYKIGSSLYGICSTAADTKNKKVVLPDFDQLLDGITVFIKFISGNTAINSENAYVTLQFYADNEANTAPNANLGAIGAISVAENFLCQANGIISFTLDNVNGTRNWRVNNNMTIEEGTTNGTIKVNGQVISIHGLGTAAYTATTDYATAAQGTLAANAMPKSGGEFTGPVTLSSDITSSSAALSLATKNYVDSQTAGLSGLTGAMHFKGITSSAITDGGTEAVVIVVDGNNVTLTPESGDVVLSGHQEYVWSGSAWELLGDEGSYALKSSRATITEVASLTNVTVGSASGWQAGGQASLTIAPNTNTAADLTTTEYSIPYVTQAGTPMEAEVSNGILTLTAGIPTTLGTNFIVKGVNVFTANVPATINFTPNTLPQLTVTDTGVSRITTNDTIVVVPDNANNNNNNENNP